MSKIKLNIATAILNALAAPLQMLITTLFMDMLEKLRAKDPQAHKTVVLALYRPVGQHLHDLSLKSKTSIDDAVVDGLTAAIEGSAEAGEVTLPELEKEVD